MIRHSSMKNKQENNSTDSAQFGLDENSKASGMHLDGRPLEYKELRRTKDRTPTVRDKVTFWEEEAAIAESKIQKHIYMPRILVGYMLSIFVLLYLLSVILFFGYDLYSHITGEESYVLSKAIKETALANFYRYSFIPVIVVAVAIFSSLGNKLLSTIRHIFSSG